MPSKGKLNREQAATVPAGECSRGKEHGRSQSRKRGPIQVTGKGFLEEDGEAKGEEVAEGVPGSCAARAKVLRQRVSSALGNYSQHCRLALVMWMEPLREAQRKVLTVLPSANLQSNGSNRINELETGFRHKPSPRTRTCYCAYSNQRMCLLAKGWAVTIKS